MKTIETLIHEIKSELVDDLDRYDNDYETWVDVVYDCPSNTLSGLYGEFVNSYGDETFESTMKDHIVPYIRSLKR